MLAASARPALTTVSSPASVLDFWFAGAWGTPAMGNIRAPPLVAQMPLWFGVGSAAVKAAMDAECRERAGLIRAAGRSELNSAEWCSSDGLYAQMLLCDQLARNAFRGTPEAFEYDQRGMAMARELVEAGCHLDQEMAYYFFLCTPGQHSEQPADHAFNGRIVDYLRTTRYPPTAGAEAAAHVEEISQSVLSHMAVIDRFGRYPHRNAALGRHTTSEEEVWLADDDNLPGWAKSQIKPPVAES